MSSATRCSVVVIGGGPAGYTAAIYSARANRRPIVLEGDTPGGQLMITGDVENYSGFANGVQGPWFMEQMKAQAAKLGARLVQETVSEVNFGERPFLVRTESGSSYLSDAVILATGAQAKWLGLPGEASYRGRGVSACATCDGFFYRDKSVAVVGGGNSAVEEALFLSNIARHVTVIHRRNRLRAERVLQDRLLARLNVRTLLERQIVDISGSAGEASVLQEIELEATNDGRRERLKVDGLFVAIGHRPNTETFRTQLELDQEGYIVTQPDSTRTNVPGVFAAGDVKDKLYRQAITAAGSGCMAALDAERFLEILPS